jgi:hypothetical protein
MIAGCIKNRIGNILYMSLETSVEKDSTLEIELAG